MSENKLAVIGGTGVGEQLGSRSDGTSTSIETPYGPPSSEIVRFHDDNGEFFFLARHGPGHIFPPTAVPYRANIWALKSLGVTHILASGATGSLREEIRPRDLVVPDQVIDRTVRRATSFFDEPGVVAHIEFAEPFCRTLRERLLASAGAAQTTTHDAGTYICMEGPVFSTVAESRMHRAWGGDLIGMTAMPEAKLAREAQMCYALLALPTDYDCWRPHDPAKDQRALLAEIIANAKAVTAFSIAVLAATLTDLRANPPGDCSCRHSLDLAIWSDKTRISDETRRTLGPILPSQS